MTIEPFNLPRNFSKSFFSFASKYTTVPLTAPGVPGDHAADAIVSGWSAGAVMRARAVPRVHGRATAHGSRCAFDNPYSANFCFVHSLARLSPGEPLMRAPMLSERYSRFAIASLLF